MSRIGKKTIKIPENVNIGLQDNRMIVKGPKGELTKELRPEIGIKINNQEISFEILKETKKSNAFWGLTRSLVANMIEGVVNGYEKKLELEGVGYKAVMEGQDLVLNVGFSHPVRVVPNEGISLSVEKNVITVTGIKKELVGQTAANIRKLKKPEPYKGKGIHYQGEVIRRKAGKKAATTA